MKIFEEYWFLGKNNSKVPKTWPQKYNTNYNYQMPILIPGKSNGSYTRAVISVNISIFKYQMLTQLIICCRVLHHL